MGTDDNISGGISGSTTSSFAQNITPGTLKVNITGDVTGDVENNVTGTVSSLSNLNTGYLSEGSNLYHTEARVRSAISVTDSGGDGSLAYDSSSGVITYTGPNAAETRGHISGGTGVTITNGTIAIGQSVGTYDTVTFSNVTVTADLTGDVTGIVSDISNHDTDALSEGTTNHYHTPARARGSISVTDAGGDGSLAYTTALQWCYYLCRTQCL